MLDGTLTKWTGVEGDLTLEESSLLPEIKESYNKTPYLISYKRQTVTGRFQGFRVGLKFLENNSYLMLIMLMKSEGPIICYKIKDVTCYPFTHVKQ